MLVQKKQVCPIKLKGVKPEAIPQLECDDLDELALSTIRLSLSKTVHFNVQDQTTAYGMWTKLENLYEKQSAPNKVFLLKKLVDLRMKEGTSVMAHLNEFNNIFNALTSQRIEFIDEVKAMFLLCSLQES